MTYIIIIIATIITRNIAHCSIDDMRICVCQVENKTAMTNAAGLSNSRHCLVTPEGPVCQCLQTWKVKLTGGVGGTVAAEPDRRPAGELSVARPELLRSHCVNGPYAKETKSNVIPVFKKVSDLVQSATSVEPVNLTLFCNALFTQRTVLLHPLGGVIKSGSTPATRTPRHGQVCSDLKVFGTRFGSRLEPIIASFLHFRSKIADHRATNVPKNYCYFTSGGIGTPDGDKSELANTKCNSCEMTQLGRTQLITSTEKNVLQTTTTVP
ncbi:hypothetical protein PoB_006975000 [Plakobranchus ocellatus]|uniref:Uncharacterized protein n=1 Tax=Plakobranchus ocellatus TaxID=259542 RepID=A0AAV4DGT3_9GAST|nr:hypothetical protein PoB_006975000 [Plakobranchus ocellatus]